MNVLSLYDGISCGMVALERAGIKVDNYYAAEIDKYAQAISEANYPSIIRMGDVTKWQDWNVDWGSIDLVLAGFPCQSWSMAGQQLGDKDERGALFWTTIDIIKNVLTHNPNAKFLMENVKMKKEFEDYITHHTEQALGYVEKTLINSSLVSAQSRPRFYWSNFKVGHPKDKGLLLKSVLEKSVDSKYHLSKEAIEYMSRLRNGKPRWEYHKNNLNGKAACLTANMYKGVPYGVLIIPGLDSVTYRKLTPLECERLQTLPDNFTLVLDENGKQLVSNTQRYKSIGNGWSVDVIAHILRGAF